MTSKMTEGSALTLIFETDVYAKKLKRSFDSWREVILHVNSILLWKKKAYPWVIFIATSFLFMELAYYDPSFLTTISLVFFFFTILDYLGPFISVLVFKPNNWNASKERELEEICKSLSGFILNCKQTWNSIMEMKSARPNQYYPIAVGLSVLCAWIGNGVNNLLLTYFFVLGLLMLPAIIHHGLIQKYYEAFLKSNIYGDNIPFLKPKAQ